jgi:hypothetical protein
VEVSYLLLQALRIIEMYEVSDSFAKGETRIAEESTVFVQVSRIVGQMWKKLPAEERRFWERAAEKEKEEHKKSVLGGQSW